MTALTHREAELLEFLRAHVRAHGIAPSFDEIAAHLGLLSKSGVSRMVDTLVAKGMVRRLSRRWRSLEVVGGAAHPASCRCRVCTSSEDNAWRFHLMLIQAVKAQPPAIFSAVTLSGIRLLSEAKRAQVLAQVQPAAPKSRAAFPSGAR